MRPWRGGDSYWIRFMTNIITPVRTHSSDVCSRRNWPNGMGVSTTITNSTNSVIAQTISSDQLKRSLDFARPMEYAKKMATTACKLIASGDLANSMFKGGVFKAPAKIARILITPLRVRIVFMLRPSFLFIWPAYLTGQWYLYYIPKTAKNQVL